MSCYKTRSRAARREVEREKGLYVRRDEILLDVVLQVDGRDARQGSSPEVRTLVKNKQLEFANAGWSMHDEARGLHPL